MKNNNVVQRILLFLIAIPVIGGGVFFLPYQKHLFFNLCSLVFSFLATRELLNLFKNKGIELNSRILPLLSIPLPLTAYLIVRFNFTQDLLLIVLTTIIIFILIISISTKKSGLDFSNNITFVSSGIFSVIYPSYFISYIVRFSQFESASLIIGYFIVIVFLNDAGAWFFGVLFGKNNRGVVKVSMNKSVMGFIGGTIGTYLFFGIARYIIPELQSMPIYMYIILSAIISLVTITGDLVESALKRSSNVKDSGNVIMGRGGILDSIDSLLLVAPIYYYILKFYSEGM